MGSQLDILTSELTKSFPKRGEKNTSVVGLISIEQIVA